MEDGLEPSIQWPEQNFKLDTGGQVLGYLLDTMNFLLKDSCSQLKIAFLHKRGKIFRKSKFFLGSLYTYSSLIRYHLIPSMIEIRTILRCSDLNYSIIERKKKLLIPHSERVLKA